MIILPPLKEYTEKRPGKTGFEEACLVPSRQHEDFWNIVYRSLFACELKFPIKESRIDPVYGYFGKRMHPVTFEPHYFHLGLEFDVKKDDMIRPIFDGVLEYSGYNAINGHYILISHPHIKTEDGYVMHSMYCHLKKALIKFNSYQKMLREISLGSYPEIAISRNDDIAHPGSSGLVQKEGPRLYLQIDFRKIDCAPIAVDALQAIQGTKVENLSIDIRTKEDFAKLLKKNKS